MMIFLVAALAAQTAVDLRTQTRNVDFSAASSTKTARVGTTLPASCSVGELFFHSAATAGTNWYGCTATNVWTLQSSGGTSGAGLADCKVTVSGNTASVGAPCRIVFGTVTHVITDTATATLSGTTSSGTVYFYWNQSGQLIADENTPATLTCTNCFTASTGGFPFQTLKIAYATFSSNTFGTVADYRAFLGTRTIDCGVGLTCSENGASGLLTITPDMVNTLQTIAATQAGIVHYCPASGASTTTYACNLSPALPSYATGMQVIFRPDLTNSGPLTLNISGLGSRPVQKAQNGVLTELSAGEMTANIPYQLLYDGSAFVVQPYETSARLTASLVLAAQTTDLGAQTLLAAGHPAGLYRITTVFSVTAVGTSTASVDLAWKSPVSATNLVKTILSTQADAVNEAQVSYVIRSTGASALTLDPAFAGDIPTYSLHATVERLQ